MHVRKRLQLNAAVSATAALVVALILFTGLYRVHSAFEELDISDEILKSLFQRDTLRFDYLITGSERAREQWLAGHAQISKTLKTASEKFEGAEDKKRINELIRHNEATAELFRAIVENRERTKSGEVSAEESKIIENRLLTQVNIRLYGKVLNIHALRDAARRRVFYELKLTGWGIAIVISLVAAIAAISSWSMGRSIGSRIRRLREGSSIIGEGNLRHRIGMEGEDEFAELSRAFDAMSAKLSVSYLELQNEITERRRAEDALRESEMSLRGAIDTAELGTWEHDLMNSMIRFDERSRGLFGLVEDRPFSTEEILSLIHKEDLPRVQEAVNAASDPGGKGVCEVEQRIIRPDGSLRWVMMRGHVLNGDDEARERPIRLRGTLMDLTERKRAEEELRSARDELEKRVRERTMELERRNLELQNFTFVAAHDLQEPLRKIQTFGDLVSVKCGDSVAQEGLDYIRRMRRTAARMQQVLNSLLEYSRLTSNVKPFRRVGLDEIARDAVSDFELQIWDTGASVEIGSLPEIDADFGQMVQLFQNLLGNALRFRRQGTRLIVKIYAEYKTWDGSGNEKCKIFVEDNGIGFDEKYLDKIFAPFQRLHSKDEYEGIGMGLAICSKIAERHKGAITARSTPGKGSTFIVSLPVNQAKL